MLLVNGLSLSVSVVWTIWFYQFVVNGIRIRILEPTTTTTAAHHQFQGSSLLQIKGRLRLRELKVLVGSLDFTKLDTQNGLLTLLHFKSFRQAYLTCTLEDWQAQSLVEAFQGLPKFHPLVLPFEFVSNSITMTRAIIPILSMWHPGSIAIEESYQLHFTDMEMKLILGKLVDNPEYCGNVTTYWLSKRLNPNLEWELVWGVEGGDDDDGKDVRASSMAIFSSLSEGLRRVHSIRPSLPIESLPIAKILSGSALKSDRSKAYKELRAFDDYFSPARRALWHGKLVYLILYGFRYGQSLLTSRACSTFLPLPPPSDVTEYFFNYFKVHQLSVAPPFIVWLILEEAKKLSICASSSLRPPSIGIILWRNNYHCLCNRCSSPQTRTFQSNSELEIILIVLVLTIIRIFQMIFQLFRGFPGNPALITTFF